MTETSNLDRIKDDLRYWAHLTRDSYGVGFPKKSNFVNERVQSSASNDVYVAPELPAKVVQLVTLLHSFAPEFVKIVFFEYKDSRPQKTKAQLLNLTRERYSQRLSFMHENLAYLMYGESNKM